MSDLISIIMPVKNGLPYLEECLQSIINQTYPNWELIAVNDHSDDFTQAVLDQYALLDSRIKPRIIQGSGIIDALRSGYAASSGNYITRMDADDIMPSHKLEVLLSSIQNLDFPSVATGQVKYFSEQGVNDGYKNYESWLNELCKHDNHYQYIYKECVIPSPCWMIKRSYFDIIGAFDSEVYPEDYDLCFRMYRGAIKVIPCNEVLHLWRDHGARTSRNDDNYSDNRFLDLKLSYYSMVEFQQTNELNLLGAGKKGKYVARYLIDNNIRFNWWTNNPKKIGVNIFGKILKDYELLPLEGDEKYIITIANKEEQLEIDRRLSSLEKNNVHFFC